MIKNPITKILEEKKLTQVNFAIMADTHASAISILKAGAPKEVPQKVLAIAEKLGYSAVVIKNNYELYRKEAAKTLTERATGKQAR